MDNVEGTNITMSFVIPVALKSELETQAADEQRSMSSLLRQIIEYGLPQRRAMQKLAQALRDGHAVVPVPDGNVTPGDGWGYPVANEG
jgi:lauroyl/myristoyl acyltransferase